MKKIVRLTESDLVRIVKRIINEQPEEDFELRPGFGETFGENDPFIAIEKSNTRRMRKILDRYFDPNFTIGVYIGSSEGIDFNDYIEFCNSKTLYSLNLEGTPNNFNEVCDGHNNEISKDFWIFSNR